MIKPFGRWCAVIVLSALKIIFLLPLYKNNYVKELIQICWVNLVPVSALAADPTTAAQDSANAVMQQFGTSDGIRQNASLPLTSDNSQLFSIDQTDSASVQISNPSSNVFLKVSIQQSATGDIMPMKVSQDLNFDGAFDYTYQVPFQTSGICANGIISCDSGTWDNCDAYEWGLDNSTRATLQNVPMSQLAGCYCVNQSCGISSNTQVMLKDIGGAVVSEVQAQKGGYVISRVELNSNSISYYGQDSSGSPTGNVPQADYYNNQAAMTTDMSNEVINQAADSESYYSMMTTSFSGRGTATGQQTCTISRNVSVDEVNLADIITPVGGSGAVQICGGDCIRLILGRQGDNYWSGSCAIYEENYKVYVNKPDLIRKATLIRAIWDDYIQVWIGGSKVYNGPNGNFPPETSGACELSTS